MIPIDVIGEVINGPHPGMRVRVVDDADNTGGFLIFTWWPSSNGPNADAAFDDWVESREALDRYFREFGHSIRWADGQSVQPGGGA